MNDNEVMVKIICWMISEVKNEEYIEKLNIILDGIKTTKHIEENKSPAFQSRLLFGMNIFPFRIQEYREMAELL